MVQDHPKSRSELGERLRRLRLARGLSQDALASATGGQITRQAIADIEAGRTKRPQMSTAEILATALSVSSFYLMTGREQQVLGGKFETLDAALRATQLDPARVAIIERMIDLLQLEQAQELAQRAQEMSSDGAIEDAGDC